MEHLIRIENIQYPLQILTWIGILIFGILSGYYLINIGNRHIERSKRIIIDVKLLKRVLLGIIITFLVIILMRRYEILGRVLGAGIIGLILAFIFNPLVDKMEKKGYSRIVGVLIVYLSILIIITLLIIVVVPKTAMEVKNLALELPVYAENIAQTFSNFFDNLPIAENNPVYVALLEAIDNSYNTIIGRLMEWVTNSASEITVFISHFLQNIISIGFTLALVLIMTFYFLVDKDMYTSKIKVMIPETINKDISYLGNRIDTVLTEFIRGRLILAVFVGILTAILLLILRIDFAIIIGIITMIADIIPYIGPLLGFVPAFLFALIESPIKALIVALFYVLIQWAENNIMAPKIIGNSMGLNPLFIFLAIVIGGGVFGVWGMVISVPLAAIGMILIDFFREKYKLYRIKNEKDGQYKI